MLDFIEFHDSELVGYRFYRDRSLTLEIKLDNVWNGGSNRAVKVELQGISAIDEARSYFVLIAQIRRYCRLCDQGLLSWEAIPIPYRNMSVERLEFLKSYDRIMVGLNLTCLGSLLIDCEAVACHDFQAIRYAS